MFSCPTRFMTLVLALALGVRAAGAWEAGLTGIAPAPDQAADLAQDLPAIW